MQKLKTKKLFLIILSLVVSLCLLLTACEKVDNGEKGEESKTEINVLADESSDKDDTESGEEQSTDNDNTDSGANVDDTSTDSVSTGDNELPLQPIE